ncbi:hypothetical protein C2E23DRAFT_903007 [Lenzites betulinus]|nr:hypothetical protein C2E23DRAFT_903007 [Lenzites betulinus]
MALPPNPPRGDPQLLVTEDGQPRLPEVDNSWARDDVVTVLESYFRLCWLHARPDEAGLRWPTVTADPAKYLHAPWDVICGSDPTGLSLVEVIVFYTQLLEAQRNGNPFCFRRPNDNPTHDSSDPLKSSGGEFGIAQAVPRVSTSVPHTPTMGTRTVKVFPTPSREGSAMSRQGSATPRSSTSQGLLGSVMADNNLFSVREEDEDASNGDSFDRVPSRVGKSAEDPTGNAIGEHLTEQDADPLNDLRAGAENMGEGLQAGVDAGAASMGSSVVDEGEHASPTARRSIPAKRTRMRASVGEQAAGDISAEDAEDAGGDLPKRRRSTRRKVQDASVNDAPSPPKTRAKRAEAAASRGKRGRMARKS